MRKISRFIQVFRSSLFDPKAYAGFLKRTFTFSGLYLFGLLVFLVFAKSLAIAIPLVLWSPHAKETFTEYRQKALDWYPTGLVITYNDGSVRTNMDEPFSVPFPKDFGYTEKAFITFDTRRQAKSITEYQTLVLVTKNSIIYPDTSSEKGYKIYPLEKNGDYFMITNTNYKMLVDKLYSLAVQTPRFFIGAVFILLGIIPFLFGGLWFLMMIARIFFLTFITYGLSRILKKPFTFGQLVQLGLHAATFPLIFELMNSSNNMGIPFAFSFPFVVWMVIVMISLHQVPHGTLSSKSV